MLTLLQGIIFFEKDIEISWRLFKADKLRQLLSSQPTNKRNKKHLEKKFEVVINLVNSAK
jgi:hypothetical protein